VKKKQKDNSLCLCLCQSRLARSIRFSTESFRPFMCCQTCGHDVLNMNEPILMHIGMSGPPGKGMKQATLGVRRSRSPDVIGSNKFSIFRTESCESWSYYLLLVLCTLVRCSFFTSSLFRLQSDYAFVPGDDLSGKLGNVREFDSCQGFTKNQRNVRGKNLVREKWPKTVYC